jgi:diaminopimelate epimerase
MSDGVRLVKMSGAGNDFIVLDGEGARKIGDDMERWVRRVCRRGMSVGADGVLVVEPARDGRIHVRFYNPDGGTAFCGNGSRCAARFALLRRLAGPSMVLATEAGDVPAVVDGSRVRLALPPPRGGESLVLDAPEGPLAGRHVDAGAPHFVVGVDDVSAAPLSSWGPFVRGHARFAPRGANLTVIEPRGDDRLAVRTWERGVEQETLSCGSGAVAAAFSSRLDGGPARVTVLPAGGIPLAVELTDDGASLEGDARIVFETVIGTEATNAFPD